MKGLQTDGKVGKVGKGIYKTLLLLDVLREKANAFNNMRARIGSNYAYRCGMNVLWMQ